MEGDNRNSDWWEFEQEPGRILNSDKSGIACDHYNRYREDFALLSQMNNNAHRLSIEWSRVEPSPGEFDRRQVRHYRDVLSELRERGMEPMLTLHHFTSPLWFARRGGWAAPGSHEAFVPFVRKVAEELGDLVHLWCTINEPNIYALHGWLYGEFPPGKKGDLRGAYRVLANLRRGHLLAYECVKAVRPEASVGVAHHLVHLMPASRKPWDRLATRAARLFTDHWPAGRRWERIVDTQSDFIGVQHYYGQLVSFAPLRPQDHFVRATNPPDAEVSEFGYAVDPRWIRPVLDTLRATGKPIYITESGLAASDDTRRQAFLRETAANVLAAINDGVDVRGYFHWTSMDNFEWSRGYSQLFGLIAVDRNTLERTPKPSAGLFSRIAQSNAPV